MRMVRTGDERGRRAGIFRDLAPIAAAAGAAALTVTLVVGPTTARLRASSSEASEAALAIDVNGRSGVPEGDIEVRVRPRRPAPTAALTDVFELVSVPVASTPAASPSTFVVSLRPQPSTTVRFGGPDGRSAIVPAPVAETPAPSVLSAVFVAPTVAPTTPGVTSANAPTKRPGKPLRPVKDRATAVSAAGNAQAGDNALARADRAEGRTADKADVPSNDKAASPSNDEKADKSKK